MYFAERILDNCLGPILGLHQQYFYLATCCAVVPFFSIWKSHPYSRKVSTGFLDYTDEMFQLKTVGKSKLVYSHPISFSTFGTVNIWRSLLHKDSAPLFLLTRIFICLKILYKGIFKNRWMKYGSNLILIHHFVWLKNTYNPNTDRFPSSLEMWWTDNSGFHHFPCYKSIIPAVSASVSMTTAVW